MYQLNIFEHLKNICKAKFYANTVKVVNCNFITATNGDDIILQKRSSSLQAEVLFYRCSPELHNTL